jgi:hypothetical protein
MTTPAALVLDIILERHRRRANLRAKIVDCSQKMAERSSRQPLMNESASCSR